ncbi:MULTISPECIES: hypothetical protein [Bacillus cereus group]|uniref:hypothetical protein n=1 Tax=Bacillus cereus group TaxID=86661 RepID=UPI000BF6F7F9|nr:hypothetical protein [Bacillus cereus]PFR21720.1 hypothetical protein COK23_07820 [Bacillus cereus]
MKVNVNLPETDERIRKHLRYLILVHIFNETVKLPDLCQQNGILPRQLYRAFKGESSYRSQSSVAHTLIKALPYEVRESDIEQANYLLDLVCEYLLAADSEREDK